MNRPNDEIIITLVSRQSEIVEVCGDAAAFAGIFMIAKRREEAVGGAARAVGAVVIADVRAVLVADLAVDRRLETVNIVPDGDNEIDVERIHQLRDHLGPALVAIVTERGKARLRDIADRCCDGINERGAGGIGGGDLDANDRASLIVETHAVSELENISGHLETLIGGREDIALPLAGSAMLSVPMVAPATFSRSEGSWARTISIVDNCGTEYSICSKGAFGGPPSKASAVRLPRSRDGKTQIVAGLPSRAADDFLHDRGKVGRALVRPNFVDDIPRRWRPGDGRTCRSARRQIVCSGRERRDIVGRQPADLKRCRDRVGLVGLELDKSSRNDRPSRDLDIREAKTDQLNS